MTSNERLQRLLQIRVQLGKSSTSKFQAYLNRVQDDGRIRGNLMYHGAGTGRWTAAGVQLQNLPSRGLLLTSEEVPLAMDAAKAGCTGLVYDNPLDVAQSCIRGALIPAEGCEFYCADYSAIEGRGLAWMAGEDYVLDAYRAGKRMYCVAAAGVYRVPYDKIYTNRKTDPAYAKMDAVGKVIELACGYQGSLKAFRKMERTQGLDLGMSDEEVKINVSGFRESRPMTVRFWKGLETACFEAVDHPGTVTTYRDIKFKVIGRFLMMRLPSGRMLYYFDPQIEPQQMPWLDDKTGQPAWKDCVSVWGVDSETKQWKKFFLYGGLLANNAVQGGMRDVLAGGMLRCNDAGYPSILTVHDEILAEVRKGFGSLEHMTSLMTQGESWTPGLPITAAGWTGPRYKKD